jgi:hypothetical protein
VGTCWHEAGHAVAHIVQGLTIGEVNVIETDTTTGCCIHASPMMYDVSNSRERRAIARKCIVTLFAGMEAERLVDPDAPDHHADADQKEAFAVSVQYHVFPRVCRRVGDYAHLAYLDKLRIEARRLVKKHREQIELLAIELKARRRLSHEEAEQVIGL